MAEIIFIVTTVFFSYAFFYVFKRIKSRFQSHQVDNKSESKLEIDNGKFQTHYDNLKVARNAPDSVIKVAYKVLCQTYHPDRFQGNKMEAERIMKIINRSYSELIDPDKRAKHDAWIKEQKM
ncbi:hypothetical protein A1507_16840 [Methylomonas koyamae]|uniref:J domain-containing protein n=1 Tax=Methylomonas koyamae TaxID=702114 RepID=A0A177N6T6_9GAMM|nr:DnaJ domain-containing protein [Methylomonas koyamae]OAI13748.1 hypothetical protein A1507_16840 [Methylomonas koyamae]